jgi:hypothetical protein
VCVSVSVRPITASTKGPYALASSHVIISVGHVFATRSSCKGSVYLGHSTLAMSPIPPQMTDRGRIRENEPKKVVPADTGATSFTSHGSQRTDRGGGLQWTRTWITDRKFFAPVCRRKIILLHLLLSVATTFPKPFSRRRRRFSPLARLCPFGGAVRLHAPLPCKKRTPAGWRAFCLRAYVL